MISFKGERLYLQLYLVAVCCKTAWYHAAEVNSTAYSSFHRLSLDFEGLETRVVDHLTIHKDKFALSSSLARLKRLSDSRDFAPEPSD